MKPANGRPLEKETPETEENGVPIDKLTDLLQKMSADKFFGDVVLKFNAGRIKTVEQRRVMIAKDFST